MSAASLLVACSSDPDRSYGGNGCERALAAGSSAAGAGTAGAAREWRSAAGGSSAAGASAAGAGSGGPAAAGAGGMAERRGGCRRGRRGGWRQRALRRLRRRCSGGRRGQRVSCGCHLLLRLRSDHAADRRRVQGQRRARRVDARFRGRQHAVSRRKIVAAREVRLGSGRLRAPTACWPCPRPRARFGCASTSSKPSSISAAPSTTYLRAPPSSDEPNAASIEFAEDVGIAFNTSDAVRWPTGYGRLTSGGTKPFTLPKGMWHCIEISFDGQGREQQLFINGTQQIDAKDYPAAGSVSALKNFKFGFNQLHGPARKVWYDDVAVAPTRIKCL